MMNRKLDPRRTVYFTPAPFSMALLASPSTGNIGYIGLRNGTGGGINNSLSRLHTYVRRPVTGGSAPVPTLGVFALIYAGNAPIRMLTFAEYNFIRAELALCFGVPGNPQDFYRAGIAASLADAGITGQLANDYLAAQGHIEQQPRRPIVPTHRRKMGCQLYGCR